VIDTPYRARCCRLIMETVTSEPPHRVPFPKAGWRNYLQQSLEIPTLVRLLRLPAGGDVLEVGCGVGTAFEPLARLLGPVSLTGIDIDGEQIAAARRLGITNRVLRADVRAIPFPDASFDLVVDFGTCYLIGDPVAALTEIARVLRPGGLFTHETAVAQVLSHPTRFHGGRLRWEVVPQLAASRRGWLWATRRKPDGSSH
jgi:ubiquinone/menaquinone biosynthesis C-methylase UbiE